MTEHSVNILLIEDDAVDREAVVRLLDSTYALHFAPTGKTGMELLERIHIDCVLLDYRLPDVDGMELLNLCVRNDVPVIVLTVEEQPETIVQVMKQGAQDYLVKRQISQPSLTRSITNAIEKVELQRKLKQEQQALRERNQQVRELASSLTLAEQSERQQVSQILHDHIQQILYGIQMRIHLISLDLPVGIYGEISEHLIEMETLIEDAIHSTRALTVELSPPVLGEEGLGTALRWLATHMEEMQGLHVECDILGEHTSLSEDLRILLFQLVRELLFNVVKHAGVHRARLRMYEKDRSLYIHIEDDGKGFDPQDPQLMETTQRGFGLYSVRERLALFGGRLKIDSQLGKGTRLTILLPHPPAA